MGRRQRALVFFLFGSLLFLPAVAAAQAPTDFSDAERPLMQWPFQTLSYHVETDGLNIYQHTRIAESPDQVFIYAREVLSNRGSIGGLTVTGVSQGAEPGFYHIALGTDNVRHYVQVKPDGAGTLLIVKATPFAIVSGFYKRALFGYRLGDGHSVGVQRYDFRDE